MLEKRTNVNDPLQVNEALTDHPMEKLEYSMKQEIEQIVKVGVRIAACMAK